MTTSRTKSAASMQGLARPALLLKHLAPRLPSIDLPIFASQPTMYLSLPCQARKCSSNATTTLETLYPGSAGYKAGPPPQIKPLFFSGYIPIKVRESKFIATSQIEADALVLPSAPQELSITYSGSSGPGGQNVNKTSTKVDLRFHLESATWLTPEVKSVLADKMGSDLTKDGWIVVKSDRTRSQSLNQADALEKLRASIREALQPPKPKFTAEQEESIRKGKLKASRSVNNTDQIAICNNQTERKTNVHARHDSLHTLRLEHFLT